MCLAVCVCVRVRGVTHLSQVDNIFGCMLGYILMICVTLNTNKALKIHKTQILIQVELYFGI